MHKITNVVHLNNASRKDVEAFDPTQPDSRELISSMVLDGWDKAHPIRVYDLVGDVQHPASPAFEYPEKFESNGKIVTREGILEQYATRISGKPNVGGNSGARRCFFLPIINAVRVLLGMDPILNIPSVKVIYETDLARRKDNLRHNNLASLGKREADWYGLLDVGAEMFKTEKATETEIKVELACTKHNSQKVHAICVADNTWPSLNIVQNVLDGVFSWKDITPGELRKLTATTKKAKKKKTPPASEEDALAYLDKPKSVLNSGTPVNKGTVKELAGKTEVAPFKLALELAAEMDVEKLASYDAQAANINRLWDGLVHTNSEFGKKLAVLLKEQAAIMAAKLADVQARAAAK